MKRFLMVVLLLSIPMVCLAEDKEVAIGQRDKLAIEMMISALARIPLSVVVPSFKEYQQAADQVLKEISRQQKELVGGKQ